MFRRTILGLASEVTVCAALAGVWGCSGSSDAGIPVEDAASDDGGHGGSLAPDAGGVVLRDDASAPFGDAAVDAGDAQTVSLAKVDKLDILFDIDNSASMGDKQQYLTQAIPDLIRRLVSPNCVDSGGNATGVVVDAAGQCAFGAPEFAPVHDMHIGIVSSALGPRLGNACSTAGALGQQPLANGGTISRHNDDQGHLLTRGSDPSALSNYTETPVADTGTAGFLTWFPQAAALDGGTTDGGTPDDSGPSDAGSSNAALVQDAGLTGDGGVVAVAAPFSPALGNAEQLQTDFQSLVTGVHGFGCGIESQLESWYRFLVQPDPYASLALSTSGQAQWQGVDTALLAQRADFLRPDSLVAVIVLSDENDSEVDVRAYGGSAYHFMSTAFDPPRGTSACETNPGDPACTSCGFGTANVNTTDPSCAKGPYTSVTDWGYDLNLRHVHEKQKYGVSVQFPIERYVLGLTSPKIPDRTGEYPVIAGDAGIDTGYQGLVPANQTCTNPLFAASLPAPPPGVDPSQWQPTAAELCNLPPGRRSSALVYYSHIGGVPHQLLQTDPTDPSSPQRDKLTAADWRLILGNDPLAYDSSGIDPHMIESYQSRVGADVPAGGSAVFDPSAPEGTDPINGREWVTDSTMPEHDGLLVDREYACTFKLPVPRQCDPASVAADPTLEDSCDCLAPVSGTGSAFTHAEVPAVCNDAKPTQQDYAKAYPTIRELLLAKLLGEVPGANEGVISSLCPIHTVEGEAGDPVYGYRPAMSAIVNRLKNSL